MMHGNWRLEGVSKLGGAGLTARPAPRPSRDLGEGAATGSEGVTSWASEVLGQPTRA